MADRLEMTHGAYHNYERANGFKGRFLPMDLARRIAVILADHGINPDDVMALAGVGIDEASSPGLSMGEEKLLERFRTLDPDQRTLLMQLADAMHTASSAPSTSQITIHRPASRQTAREEHGR